MWGYTGDAAKPGAVTPFMAATFADRGAAVAAAPASGVLLQPEDAPALQTAGLPSGFWNGRASNVDSMH